MSGSPLSDCCLSDPCPDKRQKSNKQTLSVIVNFPVISAVHTASVINSSDFKSFSHLLLLLPEYVSSSLQSPWVPAASCRWKRWKDWEVHSSWGVTEVCSDVPPRCPTTLRALVSEVVLFVPVYLQRTWYFVPEVYIYFDVYFCVAVARLCSWGRVQLLLHQRCRLLLPGDGQEEASQKEELEPERRCSHWPSRW